MKKRIECRLSDFRHPYPEHVAFAVYVDHLMTSVEIEELKRLSLDSKFKIIVEYDPDELQVQRLRNAISAARSTITMYESAVNRSNERICELRAELTTLERSLEELVGAK